MGHREDLLAGAKRCLLERGYARTTARDIVAASGTNLASIGYHFGSKEALLTQALIEALTETTAEVERAMPVHPEAPVMQRLEATWNQVITSATEQPELWRASLEAFLVGVQQPQVMEVLKDLYEAKRQEIIAEFNGIPLEQVDQRDADTLGALMLAIAAGLTLQTMVDPARAPRAADLVAGLRTLANALEADTRP
ncbi:TetR/AcrR family transcriptional regulator [Crossiella sp. CA198]|uniref:TetR/AcrR family transcriptional regulator n=1 Tax=Crossiella sp. CA198 TaxID=3455607 RepID=UPI003F8D7684